MSKISHAPRLPIMLTAMLVLFGLGFTPGLFTTADRSMLAAPLLQTGPQRSTVLLPGDSAVGPAAGNQETPQIAPGGNGYLAVWEDSRTNYAGILEGFLPSGGEVTGQSLKDIYAVRLDANGQPIDTTPIIVAQATWSQTRPQVAWNGQNWLVVWNTERVANFTSTKDIHAARVSPQGQVLDSTPIVVDGNPTIDELWPVVASDGTNWVVVWLDQGAYYELDATRIAPDGTVLDPSGVPIHTPSFPNAPYNARLTWAGDEFLLAWSGNNAIQGLRFNSALQSVGGVFPISAGTGGNFPDVASNGTDFFVVWQFSSSVYGTRVNHAGQVLDPGGINISGSHGGYPLPEVAWDGTQWFATWVSGNNTYVARVATNGTLLDPNGIVVSGTAYTSALTGQPGGGARLVWSDLRTAAGRYDIYSAAVAPNGTVGAAAAIALGAPAQLRLRFAANGVGYLVTFLSETAGDIRIKGQRLDAAGNALDAEPFLIAGGSLAIRNPAVAWNGLHYLVVWEQNTTIYGRRVAPDGTVLDPTPITIMPGNNPDVAALGDTFLVVDTHEPTNHFRPAYGARVSDAGAVLGAPVQIGGSYSVNIRVAAFGARWLAVWQQHPTHDNPYSRIYGAFVNPDGTGAGSFLAGGSNLSLAKTPSLAIGPAQGLLVYYGRSSGTVLDGDIYARRLLADGTFLDSDPGIAVTSAPNAQFLPAAAWDGSEYAIAYEDHRNVAYLDRARSDIYGTRVDPNGVVLDPTGFVIANDSIPEVLPAVVGQPGSYLVGYSDFRDDAPYTAYRATVQLYQAGTPPTPPPTATATPLPPTATPICGPSGDYVISAAANATIVPGTLDSGNHCEDCDTTIPLPFPVRVYDQTYTQVLATANGTLNFVTTNQTGFINFCLPYSGLDTAILPYWDDLHTDGPNQGIFTSVSGSAPNRIFNIEWRAGFYGSGAANFEVRLYENADGRFDIIYGPMDQNGSGGSVGVQKATGTRYTQYACNQPLVTAGLQLTFTMTTCPPTTPAPATRTPPPMTSTPAPPTGTVVLPTGTAAPPTNTPAPPSVTATVCAVAFTDVDANNPLYAFIRCLACRGIISGYSDGTFRPYADVTRGQLSKILAQAAGLSTAIPSTQQTFSDVPANNAFWVFTERLAATGAISGYGCGGPGEPCDPQSRPYFRWTANATRGQIAKITATTANFTDPVPPAQQTFADVPSSNVFWAFIERLAARQIISGYTCGGAGEPCDPALRPYFRWGANTTRGQLSKIASNTFYPNCQTP